jgi:hypothetical protein
MCDRFNEWYYPNIILPIGRQFCLVFCDGNHSNYYVAQYEPSNKSWYFSDGSSGEVLAWRPLPIPPSSFSGRIDSRVYALESDPRFCKGIDEI